MDVAAKELVFDSSLYPRHGINDVNIQALVDALDFGVKLPPVIVWRETNAIIDGWHRVTAIKKRHSADMLVEVEWRDYKDRAEAFADAVRLNASHGLRIGPRDYESLHRRARELGVAQDQLAKLLKVPSKRFVKAGRVELAVKKQAPNLTTARAGAQLRSGDALREAAGPDVELARAVAELATRLGRDEVGPGHLPDQLAAVREARESGDPDELRKRLLDAAALFVWWAARTGSRLEAVA